MAYIKPAFNAGDIVCLKNTVTNKDLNGYGIPTPSDCNYFIHYYIVILIQYSATLQEYTYTLIPIGFIQNDNDASDFYIVPQKWAYKESWLQVLSEELLLSENVQANLNAKYFKVEEYYVTCPSIAAKRNLWKIHGAVRYGKDIIILYEALGCKALRTYSNNNYKETRYNYMYGCTPTKEQILKSLSYDTGTKYHSLR